MGGLFLSQAAQLLVTVRAELMGALEHHGEWQQVTSPVTLHS